MSALTNDELLQRHVTPGDRAALDELVRRNVDFVYATARRQVGDPHLAEDVTQAVFLVLLQKRAAVSAEHLSGWLFKTTRYAVANARKMQTRRSYHESQAPVRAESSAGAESESLAYLLDDALASLRPSDRELLILRFLRATELSEVSRLLRLSEATTRKRITRALHKLRQFFAAKGVTILSEATIISGMAAASAEKSPAAVSNAILQRSPSKNAALISHAVVMMQFFIRIKAAAVVILLVAAIAGGSELVRHVRAGQPQIQTPAAPAPLQAAASAPATQPDNTQRDELQACTKHLLDIGVAIFTYADRRRGHLPSSLGPTLPYIRPTADWTPTSQPRGTLTERAALYLSPADAKAKSIPGNPTAQWVDQNTSFVYLGDPGITLADIRSADVGTTVIAHVKLDEGYVIQINGKPTTLIPVLMLDGHVEGLTVEKAKQMIDESKKRYDDVKRGL